MARSTKVYVLSWWASREVFAAFTVKHELHTFAKREGLYAKNVRVTSVPDGLHRRGNDVRDMQLSENTP